MTVKLSQLKRSQSALVIQVQHKGAGQRLLELGLVPGAELKVLAEAPFGGDPILIRVLGTRLALRREDADLVEVRVL